MVCLYVQRDLVRKAGLAHAAGAGHGHDARTSERADNHLDVGLASDERGDRRREISRPRVERLEGRELVGKSGDPDLEDTLGTIEVAESVIAEVDEIDVGGEVVAHELFGCARHDDLATVRRAHQPSRAVERRPVVVAVAQLGFAGVHTHTNS